MSTAKLKPIETTYRGHRFRSRLEARWAVFLDALGVEWWYEHEGYHLGDGPFGKRLLYLPDFYIPEQRGVSKGPFFVEVKGDGPSVADEKKMEALARASGLNVYCFTGRVSPRGPDIQLEDRFHYGHEVWLPFPDGAADIDHRWCECPNCGIVGIEFQGYADRLSCKCAPGPGRFPNSESPRLLQAYTTARTARFGR